MAVYHARMTREGSHIWPTIREHATHWVIGGALLAATGFAPEEWFAHTVHGLHISESVLHLWGVGVDVRVVPIAIGVAVVSIGLLRQRQVSQITTAEGPLASLAGSERPVRWLSCLRDGQDGRSSGESRFNLVSRQPRVVQLRSIFTSVTEPGLEVAPAWSAKPRVAAIAAAWLAFLIPAYLAYGFILNHFYLSGATFFDAGWFADLMWHKRLSLPNPPAVRFPGFPPASFYAIHVSPIFSVISATSFVLPFDRARLLALYIGISHGIMGFFMCAILLRWRREESFLKIAFAAVFSTVFALNGLGLSIITYPHFEIMFPGLALGFFCFLLERRFVHAALIGAIAMMVREDVGFHLSFLIFFLMVLNVHAGIPIRDQKPLYVSLVASFMYSVAMLLVQHFAFPGTNTFGWVYGDPFLSGLTREVLTNRLTYILESKTYIWVPLALGLIGAVVFRSRVLLVGTVWCFPWLVLQILAANDIPGKLQAHYAFPAVLSVGWICVFVLLNPSVRRGGTIMRVVFACLVLAATFYPNPEVTTFFHNAWPAKVAKKSDPTLTFINAVRATLPMITRVKTDAAVVSLMPEDITVDAWLQPVDWYTKPLGTDVDLLLFFRQGFERYKAVPQIKVMKDPRAYSVPGTEIIVVTSGPADPRLPITAFLRPTTLAEMSR